MWSVIFSIFGTKYLCLQCIVTSFNLNYQQQSWYGRKRGMNFFFFGVGGFEFQVNPIWRWFSGGRLCPLLKLMPLAVNRRAIDFATSSIEGKLILLLLLTIHLNIRNIWCTFSHAARMSGNTTKRTVYDILVSHFVDLPFQHTCMHWQECLQYHTSTVSAKCLKSVLLCGA